MARSLNPLPPREYKTDAAKSVDYRFTSFSNVPAEDVVKVLESFRDSGWRLLHVLSERTNGLYTVIGEKATL